jgi:hypothetical protein
MDVPESPIASGKEILDIISSMSPCIVMKDDGGSLATNVITVSCLLDEDYYDLFAKMKESL